MRCVCVFFWGSATVGGGWALHRAHAANMAACNWLLHHGMAWEQLLFWGGSGCRRGAGVGMQNCVRVALQSPVDRLQHLQAIGR
jgi:hypothetical protein